MVGELDFAVGQSVAIITISITDDTEPETLEYFYVQLFNPRGNLSWRYCHLLNCTENTNNMSFVKIMSIIDINQSFSCSFISNYYTGY